MSKKTFLALKTNLNNPFVTPSDTSFFRFLWLNFYPFTAFTTRKVWCSSLDYFTVEP